MTENESPKATPAEPGSANNEFTCSDCLCAMAWRDWSRGSPAADLYCSKMCLEGQDSSPLNPEWSACSEFKAKSDYDLLKNWLAGATKQITDNGDFWMGKRATVFLEGDRIRIRDKAGTTKTVDIYDENEALGILRTMESGQKILPELAPDRYEYPSIMGWWTVDSCSAASGTDLKVIPGSTGDIVYFTPGGEFYVYPDESDPLNFELEEPSELDLWLEGSFAMPTKAIFEPGADDTMSICLAARAGAKEPPPERPTEIRPDDNKNWVVQKYIRCESPSRNTQLRFFGDFRVYYD